MHEAKRQETTEQPQPAPCYQAQVPIAVHSSGVNCRCLFMQGASPHTGSECVHAGFSRNPETNPRPARTMLCETKLRPM